MAGMVSRTGIDILRQQNADWLDPTSKVNNPDFFSSMGATPSQASQMQKYRDAGYEWNPVTQSWSRSPTSQGTRQADYMNGVLGAFGGAKVGGAGSPGSGSSGSLSGLYAASGMSPGPGVPGIGPINNDAANAAAFSKAKDKAGNIGRASLDALRGELGATGALGGGAEVQGVRDITENAAGGLRGVANEQAINDSNQALDIAKTNQSSAVTQRGQDINAQEAMARLAQSQNQLEWQKQMQLLQMAFSGLTNVNTPGATIGVSSKTQTGSGSSLY